MADLEEDCWLSMQEICRYFGVGRDTVYKWINGHDMPAERMGRLWKFKKDAVDAWVKAGGATGGPKRISGSILNAQRYSMSFTTGSLFHGESVTLATLFLELNDWKTVREKVLSDNLLQARTLNTSKRVCSEIISRLKMLDRREIDLLVHGNTQEQGYLLWIAVCRRYRFIGEFAVEVVRERYLSLQNDLSAEEFDSFFNKKSEWHPELENIRPATRIKLRQVLFKILREAELLTADNTLNAAMPSPRLLAAIAPDRRDSIAFFPVFETDSV